MKLALPTSGRTSNAPWVLQVVGEEEKLRDPGPHASPR